MRSPAWPIQVARSTPGWVRPHPAKGAETKFWVPAARNMALIAGEASTALESPSSITVVGAPATGTTELSVPPWSTAAPSKSLSFWSA